MCLIVPGLKVMQLRLRIPETAGEAKGLEPWASIEKHATPDVVIKPLCHSAGRNVHHQSHRPQVIGDQSVGDTAFYNVVWHVPSATVDKPRHQRARPIKLRRYVETVLVKPPAHHHPI